MPNKSQPLLLWLISGLVLGASFAQLMVSSGQPFPVSPESLLVTLPITAVAIYLSTLPVMRYRKRQEKYLRGELKDRPARVNPFYAFRVLILSRALSMAGAGFAGWHLGQLIWVFAFSVPGAQLLTPTFFGLLGGSAMLLGGILGEQNCKAPKDPDPGNA